MSPSHFHVLFISRVVHLFEPSLKRLVCIVSYAMVVLSCILQNLPEIKKYMESDAYDKKLPMNNKMAAFGNKV